MDLDYRIIGWRQNFERVFLTVALQFPCPLDYATLSLAAHALKTPVPHLVVGKSSRVLYSAQETQRLGHLTGRPFFDIHIELLRDNRGIQTLFERYNLYCLVRATARLSGVLAEAGVYRGGSAKLVCKVKGDTPLYLFDTFEGLPSVDKNVDAGFSTGQFDQTSLEEVATYLKGFENIYFYKGFFPASALGQEPERQQYRFVHLDLDLYQSTFDALGFFYPRMVKGGIIISHDYNQLNATGVRKAFEEFFADKCEPIIPLWDTQCAIVKT